MYGSGGNLVFQPAKQSCCQPITQSHGNLKSAGLRGASCRPRAAILVMVLAVCVCVCKQKGI